MTLCMTAIPVLTHGLMMQMTHEGRACPNLAHLLLQWCPYFTGIIVNVLLPFLVIMMIYSLETIFVT